MLTFLPQNPRKGIKKSFFMFIFVLKFAKQIRMANTNNIMFIRYQLLARLVKMWKDNELLEKIDHSAVDFPGFAA